MTMDELLTQESNLSLSRFTNADAFRLGQIIAESAAEKKQALSMSIRKNRTLIFFFQTDGGREDYQYWLEGKHNVVERFAHSSYYMQCYLKSKTYVFHERYHVSLDTYRFEPGAIPIIVDHVGILGSIAVSGLAPEEDHLLACKALEILKQQTQCS